MQWLASRLREDTQQPANHFAESGGVCVDLSSFFAHSKRSDCQEVQVMECASIARQTGACFNVTLWTAQ